MIDNQSLNLSGKITLAIANAISTGTYTGEMKKFKSSCALVVPCLLCFVNNNNPPIT